MNTRSKGLFVLSLLLVLSMVIAACQQAAPEPVIQEIEVTRVVGGTPETIVITATPAPEEATAPAAPAEGPIAAEGMVACQPLPELSFSGGSGTVAKLDSTSPVVKGAAAPAKLPAPQPSTQGAGNVYRIGVFEDVTTTNFWAANGPDNTVYNSYMLPPRLAMFKLSEKYFSLIPEAAAVPAPDPLVQEGDFWVTTVPIRQDITWSDGEPFTAEDVAFTANAVLGLHLFSGNWSNWYDGDFLDRVEAVDDYTVKYYYHTKPGLARHEYGVLQGPLLAEHYWAPIVAEAMGPIEALGDSPSEEDLAAAEAEAADLLFAHVPDGEPTAGSYHFSRWEAGAFLENIASEDYYWEGVTVEQWPDAAYRNSEGTIVGEPAGDPELTYTVGPYASAVVYTIYGSQDAAILALKNGEVDFVLNSLGLQRGLADQIRTDPNLTVIENVTNGFRYLSFNNRRQPMNDCAFRQAVAVLIDKEFVTGTILQGVAFPLYTFVPEGNAAWYFEDVPKLGEGLDREQRTNLAVAILEQAGFSWENDQKPTWDPDNLQVVPAGRMIMPDGTPVPELTMLAPSPGYDPLRSTFAIWIETWLNEFGVPVTAELAGFNVIVPKIFTEQDFDMYILGWSLSIFPDFLYDFFSEEQAAADGNNAGGYISQEFEDLATQLLACEDIDSCKALADEIQIMLSTEVPYVVLFDTGIIEAYRSEAIEFPFTDGLSGLQYSHQLHDLQDTVQIR